MNINSFASVVVSSVSWIDPVRNKFIPELWRPPFAVKLILSTVGCSSHCLPTWTHRISMGLGLGLESG